MPLRLIFLCFVFASASCARLSRVIVRVDGDARETTRRATCRLGLMCDRWDEDRMACYMHEGQPTATVIHRRGSDVVTIEGHASTIGAIILAMPDDPGDAMKVRPAFPFQIGECAPPVPPEGVREVVPVNRRMDAERSWQGVPAHERSLDGGERAQRT